MGLHLSNIRKAKEQPKVRPDITKLPDRFNPKGKKVFGVKITIPIKKK